MHHSSSMRYPTFACNITLIWKKSQFWNRPEISLYIRSKYIFINKGMGTASLRLNTLVHSHSYDHTDMFKWYLLIPVYPCITVWSIVVAWYHDGVMTWKRVPKSWPFARGILRSLVIPLTKDRQCWVWSLRGSSIIICWTNSRFVVLMHMAVMILHRVMIYQHGIY